VRLSFYVTTFSLRSLEGIVVENAVQVVHEVLYLREEAVRHAVTVYDNVERALQRAQYDAQKGEVRSTCSECRASTNMCSAMYALASLKETSAVVEW